MQELIDTLAAAFGLAAPPQPEESAFALTFGGVIVTFLCPTSASGDLSSLVLSTRLGTADAEPSIDLLEMLLAGNVAHDALAHHGLCADAQGGIFLMRHLDAAGLDTELALRALDRFVAHAALWQAKLLGALTA
ncbi:MAG: type III secretion system chaperone [Pseudomonadota bacterium]